MGRMSYKDYNGLEAELYDVFRGGDELDEIGFYGNVAAEKGGNCLDLGCGTGRVLIPLAGQGIEAAAECYKLTNTVAFIRGVAYQTDINDPVASCVATFMRASSSKMQGVVK